MTDKQQPAPERDDYDLAYKIVEQMGLGLEFRNCSCGQLPCARLRPIVDALAKREAEVRADLLQRVPDEKRLAEIRERQEVRRATMNAGHRFYQYTAFKDIDYLLSLLHEDMPRRWCRVHRREEFKYESLEHELAAPLLQQPPAATLAPLPFTVRDFVDKVWKLTNDRDGWSKLTLEGLTTAFLRTVTTQPTVASERCGVEPILLSTTSTARRVAEQIVADYQRYASPVDAIEQFLLDFHAARQQLKPRDIAIHAAVEIADALASAEHGWRNKPTRHEIQNIIAKHWGTAASEQCVNCGRIRETTPDVVPQVCEVDTPEIFCVFPATGATGEQEEAKTYREGFDDAARVARTLSNVATTPSTTTPDAAREAAAREIAKWIFWLESPLSSELDLENARHQVLSIISRHFPPAAPAPAGVEAAVNEIVDGLFQHATQLTPTIKGDSVGIASYSINYVTQKVTEAIRRHCATSAPTESGEVERLRMENELCHRAFETDDLLRIPEVGNLNALQIVKKLAELSNALTEARAKAIAECVETVQVLITRYEQGVEQSKDAYNFGRLEADARLETAKTIVAALESLAKGEGENGSTS